MKEHGSLLITIAILGPFSTMILGQIQRPAL